MVPQKSKAVLVICVLVILMGIAIMLSTINSDLGTAVIGAIMLLIGVAGIWIGGWLKH